MRLFVVCSLCLFVCSAAQAQVIKRFNPAPAEPEVVEERLVPDPIDLDEVDLGAQEDLGDAPIFNPNPPGGAKDWTQGEWPASEEEVLKLSAEAAPSEIPAVVYVNTDVKLYDGPITVVGRNVPKKYVLLDLHMKAGAKKRMIVMCTEAVFNELTLGEGDKPKDHVVGLAVIRQGLNTRYGVLFVRKEPVTQEKFVPVRPRQVDPLDQEKIQPIQPAAPRGPRPGDKVADKPMPKKVK